MGGPFELEQEIVECLKQALYNRMRFLALPLGSLGTAFSQKIERIGASGEALVFNPRWLRESFRSGSAEGVIFILHCLYHCLLGHRPAPHGAAPKGLRGRSWAWDLSCDMVVWRLIGETWDGPLPPPYAALCAEAAEIAAGALSAAALAPVLEAKGPIEDLQTRFRLDDHGLWGRRPFPPGIRLGPQGEGPGTGEGEDERALLEAIARLSPRGRALGPSRPKRGSSRAARRERWREEPPAGRSNYGAVLRRFAQNGEINRINMDEFQYAWYHYGLERYGKVPIIEPLEYQERRALRELAIVIDTSASCSRDLCRRFLQETRLLLSEEGLFFDRFNLHIIQCDNRLQRDDKITSMEAFSAYLETLEITGQGGTDFRPAFEHINGLLERGEFSRLPGILYFTDGSGFYPSQMPAYEAVFVFIRDRYDAIDLPPWASSLVLEPDEAAPSSAL